MGKFKLKCNFEKLVRRAVSSKIVLSSLTDVATTFLNAFHFKYKTFINKIPEMPIPLYLNPLVEDHWRSMLENEFEKCHQRNTLVFNNVELIAERALLLDWILEVCIVLQLRRASYHFAVDYLDRFLFLYGDVPSNMLQLVGATCLVLACKMEEISPPVLEAFVYLSDNCFEVKDLLFMEWTIITKLNWDFKPVTAIEWLSFYLQVDQSFKNFVSKKVNSFNITTAELSAEIFLKATTLLDQFSLDPGFLLFQYSIIAATVVYYIVNQETACVVSGYNIETLMPCIEYMSMTYKVTFLLHQNLLSTDTETYDQVELDKNNSAFKTFRAITIMKEFVTKFCIA